MDGTNIRLQVNSINRKEINMNGKKAKLLRKAARAKTVGRPVVAYEGRTRTLGKPDPILIMSGCTRFVYKQDRKSVV